MIKKSIGSFGLSFAKADRPSNKMGTTVWNNRSTFLKSIITNINRDTGLGIQHFIWF